MPKPPRTIRVRDLPSSGNGRGIVLHCPRCGNDYSPDRGDYFMSAPDTIMRCGTCTAPLQLMSCRTVYEPHA